MDEQLIPRFVELHNETEQLLESNRVDEAKKKYLEALDAYHSIQKSTLEKHHKDLAYSNVTTLFSKVNEAKERMKVPYNLIAAAVLVIAFSILVVVKPSIVGLVSLDDMMHKPLNMTIKESGLHEITLQDRPLSLLLSGNVTGSAKVFFKQGNKLELIVDTAKLGMDSFSNICEETCTVAAQGNTITLFVDLNESSELTLTGLDYRVEQRKNTPPRWRGSTTNFKAKVDGSTIIDLNDYYTDDEDDEMVFLSTRDDSLDVYVQDSLVHLMPEETGNKRIILIASDYREVTRTPVTIEVS